MANDKHYVDIDFVKSVGTMHHYDIDAVEALYPGSVDQAIESASRKFDERAVAGDKVDEVRRHVAALAIAELWAKRGAADPSTDAQVQATKAAALQWLADAPTVDAVRKSAAPPPAPLSPENDPFPHEKGR